MIGKIILHMGRIQGKLGLGCASKCDSFHAVCKQLANGSRGTVTAQETFAIYILIYVLKRYLQLLNRHKIVTNIIKLTFFLKTGNLIILAPPASWMPHVVLKHHPHHFTKYNINRTKILVSNFLVNWEKFGSKTYAFRKFQFSISFMYLEKLQSIHSQDQLFKIQILNLWRN